MLCFLDDDFHRSDIRFIFILILLMLLTLKRKSFNSTEYFCVLSFLAVAAILSIATWVYTIFISLSGDAQLNPGAKNRSDINFSIRYWNLNSIATHNYARVSLLNPFMHSVPKWLDTI